MNNLEELYKLKWTETDNPNGWIEPTTYCQLKCPGCYRGADKTSHKPEHLKFETVINQIDWLIKNRNIHTLSIAGGEPLLYPQLNELIKYAKSKNLRTMLYTNAVSLTKEKLISLKSAGLTTALIHIDRFQEREEINNEEDIIKLRQHFVDMFREINNVGLGFIQPISKDFMQELDNTINFSAKNIDVVSLLVFTLYRDICWESDTKSKINTDIKVEDVTSHLAKIDNFKGAAYLNSTVSEKDITWLFGIKTGIPQINFGYFSPNLYKLIQERYHSKKGKFLFISRYNNIKPFSLLKYFWISGVLKIFKNYRKNKNSQNNINKQIYYQTILILRGAIKTEDKWDLCENCPDRIIYNGRLVPSCILEDLKTKDASEFKKVEF